jgi:hypothetical protein
VSHIPELSSCTLCYCWKRLMCRLIIHTIGA